eukprot:COSAG04_NODE_13732_length_594_cov_0.739394_1_plen_151_part_10
MQLTIKAVSEIFGQPSAFVAAMMTMSCAKDALFLVYAVRNETSIKPPVSEQGQLEAWHKLDHLSVEKLRAEFESGLQNLRLRLRTSKELKAANMPLNRFNFLISAMQLGVQSLRDAQKDGQKSKDFMKLGVGLAKAVVTAGAGASDAAAAA